LQALRKSLELDGLSEEAAEVCFQGWRSGTNPWRWHKHCLNNGTPEFHPSPAQVVTYLAKNYRNTGYSNVNTAKSAISSIAKIIKVLFWRVPCGYKVYESFFNLKQALPKYGSTWDVGLTLELLRTKAMGS
jgi:hypothetical protein